MVKAKKAIKIGLIDGVYPKEHLMKMARERLKSSKKKIGFF